MRIVATALAAQSERIAALEKERDDLRRSVRNFGTLQHEFMNRTEAAEARLAKAVAGLSEITEVYAGSEGIPQPMTAAESYLLRLVTQMYEAARATLAEIGGDHDLR